VEAAPAMVVSIDRESIPPGEVAPPEKMGAVEQRFVYPNETVRDSLQGRTPPAQNIAAAARFCW